MLPEMMLGSKHDRVGELGATSASERDAPTAPRSVVAYEADSFARALPDRLESEFVRCGPGDEPARVEQAMIGNLSLSLVSFGFAVRSRIESSGAVAAVARIRQAPAGARWGDTDLRVGQVRSMGPKSHHLGVNPAGVVTSAVIFDADLLRETADLLGHAVDVDNLVGPLAGSRQLDDALDDIEAVLARSVGDPIGDVTRLQDNLLASVARAARQDNHSEIWSRSFSSSDRIVNQCLDFARSTSIWQPTLVDLCRAAALSERRVRSAFQDVSDMAPNHYFRVVALNRARTQLRQSERDSTTVTAVADKLRIYHLSRFARDYRALFDESPSDTLRA
jgi:AraC family ethanolamine operon transcriptional activator